MKRPASQKVKNFLKQLCWETFCLLTDSARSSKRSSFEKTVFEHIFWKGSSLLIHRAKCYLNDKSLWVRVSSSWEIKSCWGKPLEESSITGDSILCGSISSCSVRHAAETAHARRLQKGRTLREFRKLHVRQKCRKKPIQRKRRCVSLQRTRWVLGGVHGRDIKVV